MGTKQFFLTQRSGAELVHAGGLDFFAVSQKKANLKAKESFSILEISVLRPRLSRQVIRPGSRSRMNLVVKTFSDRFDGVHTLPEAPHGIKISGQLAVRYEIKRLVLDSAESGSSELSSNLIGS